MHSEGINICYSSIFSQMMVNDLEQDPITLVADAHGWNSLPQQVMVAPFYICFLRTPQGCSSSGVPSYDFYCIFRTTCTMTAVIFRHLNRSFYLLTHLFSIQVNGHIYLCPLYVADKRACELQSDQSITLHLD